MKRITNKATPNRIAQFHRPQPVPYKSRNLRISPTAWAKLLYFRDKTDNEVGGFCVTELQDLLFIKDFVTVRQKVTIVSNRFDDEAVGDFFDEQVDAGRRPEQFARVWAHTHPGDSPEPSMTDHETFDRVFGTCQWAVMLIVAQKDNVYARLSFNVGPGGNILIPLKVDYSEDFGPSDVQQWDREYKTNIIPERRAELAAEKADTADADGDTQPTAEASDDIFGGRDMLTLEDLPDNYDYWDDELGAIPWA